MTVGAGVTMYVWPMCVISVARLALYREFVNVHCFSRRCRRQSMATPIPPLVLPLAPSAATASPSAPALAASQGTMPLGSDEADCWLRELLDWAPRPPPRLPPRRQLSSNSSDEAWLAEICPQSSGRSAPSVTAGILVASPPLLDDEGRHGQIGPGRHAQISPVGSDSMRPTARKSVPSIPLDDVLRPQTCAWTDLSTTLAACGMPIPESSWWKLPLHGSILRQAPEMPPDPVASQGAFESDVHKCLWYVLAWIRALSHVAIFKVGIAFDPTHRWTNPEGGYITERCWWFMQVMYRNTPQNCRLWERALIAKVRGIPGCYNERPGGEGVSPDNPVPTCYGYVVFAPAGGGLGVQVAWTQQLQRRGPHPPESEEQGARTTSSRIGGAGR